MVRYDMVWYADAECNCPTPFFIFIFASLYRSGGRSAVERGFDGEGGNARKDRPAAAHELLRNDVGGGRREEGGMEEEEESSEDEREDREK